MVTFQVHSFAELNHFAETTVFRTLGINEKELVRNQDISTTKLSPDKPEENIVVTNKNVEPTEDQDSKVASKSESSGLPPPPKLSSLLTVKLAKIKPKIRIDLIAKSAHRLFEVVSYKGYAC
jgi:hypothetical protein